MSSEAILQIIFAIIILNYLVDLLSGLLNYNSFNNKLPENVSDIYNDKEYLKSQEYKIYFIGDYSVTSCVPTYAIG